MTLPGHTIFGILLYYLLGATFFPFGWIIIIASHFLLDKYPDFWDSNYKKEVIKNILYGISILLNTILIVFLSIRFLHFSLLNILVISFLSMFIDITEGIYLVVKKVVKKDNIWPDKFWFNHEGFSRSRQIIGNTLIRIFDVYLEN